MESRSQEELLEAADAALEWLFHITDAELIESLENCDTIITYAINPFYE